MSNEFYDHRTAMLKGAWANRSLQHQYNRENIERDTYASRVEQLPEGPVSAAQPGPEMVL